MPNFKYYDIIKNSKDPYDFRRQMVHYAKKYGIKPAARKFETTVKTIKKWLKRWEEKKYRLKDESRRPNSCPWKIEERWEKVISAECQFRINNNKRTNAARIKNDYNIPYSQNTIRRVMKSKGFMKIVAKKKKERKKDLRELKRKYKPFEKIQVDVKYLDDIPEMYKEYIQLKLPKYQYTARCIRTGALFICYSRTKDSTSAGIFIKLLLQHLKNFDIDLNDTRIQTDNGSEFILNINTTKRSLFTQILEDEFELIHRRIPPGAKTWQSDVETSHRLIEDELYSYEIFNSYSNFFMKAHNYQKHFNFTRNNTYKEGTPKSIIESVDSRIDTNVLDFEPVLLDDRYDVIDSYLQRKRA